MAEARRKRRLAARALERRLVNEWPELFDPVHPRPLAIGIHKALKEATGAPWSVLKITLGEWTGRPAYLAALVAGVARYALDGEPCGEVTAEETEVALAKARRQATRHTSAPGVRSVPSEPTASG